MNERISAEYRNTFKTPAGEKVLADLRSEFYDVNMVLAGSADGVLMAAGAHSVVHYILEMLEDRSE